MPQTRAYCEHRVAELQEQFAKAVDTGDTAEAMRLRGAIMFLDDELAFGLCSEEGMGAGVTIVDREAGHGASQLPQE